MRFYDIWYYKNAIWFFPLLLPYKFKENVMTSNLTKVFVRTDFMKQSIFFILSVIKY